LAYADVTEIDVDAIPVIDVARLFDGPDGEAAVGRELLDVVQRIGFFYIDNHAVAPALIDSVLREAETFFARPDAEKNQVGVDGVHRGFLPIGEATMSGAHHQDFKESFVWGWDVAADDPDIAASNGILAANRWPDYQPAMADVLGTYLQTINGLGIRLLRAFAAGLGLDHGHFTQTFSKPLTRAAIIHYPPQPEDMGTQHFGVSPHTDYGCVTFLYQDGTGGLQVMNRDGEWITAHPVPGTFVVNIGDLLHRWSNDRFISNPHRVINASGRERYSVPVFVDPDWDTLVEPVAGPGETPNHPPITCADYIHAIYEKSFAYRQQS